MNDQISLKLIDAITESLPPKTNLANFLTNELMLSREAAYRRLRGDVSFTLSEACEISKLLGISMDRLMGNSNFSAAHIHLGFLSPDDILRKYYDLVKRYDDICSVMKDNPQATLYSASNLLPYGLFSSFNNLSKFRFSRWLHQSHNIKIVKSLYEITVPEYMFELHNSIINKLHLIPNNIFIWDKDIFKSLIDEIMYFANSKLLSEEDIQGIKKDLENLLDDLESMAITGKFFGGGNVSIYLSNISLEASYAYLESDNFEMSLLRVFYLNLIDSQDFHICKMQKGWIKSLRRYSTLISESGEMERIKFFNEQREYLKKM